MKVLINYDNNECEFVDLDTVAGNNEDNARAIATMAERHHRLIRIEQKLDRMMEYIDEQNMHFTFNPIGGEA